MQPDMAVLVSSFQRPVHLRRVLASIAVQQAMVGRFEVVVTDDGSEDETRELVADFARRVDFPVAMTTHPHDGFQLARCRNEGVAASTAPFLLFLDGDCLIPPDHLWQHWQRRQRGVVYGGYCCMLSEDCTRSLTTAQVERGEFVSFGLHAERKKLRRMARKAWFYNVIRHRTKPKLFGGNVAIHREDYYRVNGYDEQFRGWGCEDDDLRLRLRTAGVAIRSILPWTCTYHLWHPPGKTTPKRWSDGANVAYLKRTDRVARCVNGIDAYDQGRRQVEILRWSESQVASLCVN